MRRMMVGALFVGMLLSTNIVGCGPTAKPAEPIVLSVLYNERGSAPAQEDWLIVKEYEKRNNVVLDIRQADDADYEKAIIQTLETGDVADIVLKVWPNTIESYAAAGILLPFSDYENLMPNYVAYIEEHNLQNEVDKLRLNNGKYYLLPGYQRQIQVQQWIYRRDIFEKHDLEAPKTYDELFNSLVFLKGMYPDTTPITACWGGAHLFAMMGAGYGIPAGWAGDRYYNEEEDRWLYAPATENNRELLRFLKRSYSAGVLDPEIFTRSEEDFINRLGDGSALVTVTWISSGFGPWNEALRQNGFPDGEWAPLPVPESTIGVRALPPVDPFRKGLIVPSRVVDEPHFEDLLKFLDWAVYSEEGMTLTTWGIEGLTFENASSGKALLPTVMIPKNPEGTVDMTKEYGFDTLFNLNENEEFEDYKKPVEIVEFLDASLEAGDTLQMQPGIKLDSNAIEATRLINEKVTLYVADSTEAFIRGGLSIDEDWDEYLLELQKRGYKTLEEIWNAAWKEQKNTN